MKKRKNNLFKIIFVLLFLFLGNYILKTEALDIVPTIPEGNYAFLKTENGKNVYVFTTSWSFGTYLECNTAKDKYQKDNPTAVLTVCQQPTLQKKLGVDVSVPVTPKIGVSQNKTVYEFLAPVVGLNRMNSAGNDPTCTIATGCIGNNIGDYLNVIFKLGIGICAALAVIMLIINGITYMGDESIFAKTEAKSKIYSAILGLLIALGAWALLNTINPALTGKGGVSIEQASVEVEAQPLTKNDPYTEGTKTNLCTDGIITAQTANGGIPICASLAPKLIALISQAKSVGINLFGYGYRSKATQEGLRSQNCGGSSNIYNTSAKCNPQTALPGTSMHENGLAVDFRCDGVQISTQDNKCFLWLKANATPPFSNSLAAEPWHWSTTGH